MEVNNTAVMIRCLKPFMEFVLEPGASCSISAPAIRAFEEVIVFSS